MKNKSAVELGKLNRGKKKRISAEEAQRRRERLEIARKNRWPRKGDDGTR